MAIRDLLQATRDEMLRRLRNKRAAAHQRYLYYQSLLRSNPHLIFDATIAAARAKVDELDAMYARVTKRGDRIDQDRTIDIKAELR